MDVLSNLLNVAVLLGEPARISMLWSLIGGQTRPAGELAFFANVSPQSASLHLAKLVEAGMLSVEAAGRNRYYKIARPEVAHVVESMATLIPATENQRTQTLRQTADFRLARTCYDHLAGKLAVEIIGSMQKRGFLRSDENDFVLTKNGSKWFGEFGIDIDALKWQRRAFARKCLDWSERQHHLAGSLGAALLEEMFKRKWLARQRASRIVRITLDGRKAFDSIFGIHL